MCLGIFEGSYINPFQKVGGPRLFRKKILKYPLEQPAIKYKLRNHEFTIPRFNTVSFGKHSLRYMGPMVWSSVPSNVKKASTLSSFKYTRKLFTYTVHSFS